ncbi:SRPBCC family protein [Halorubrum luteum]
MLKASDTIHVAAPVEDVFGFLDDPHNHAEVTPRLTDVRDIERLDNGGKRLSYTYRMAGVGVDGELVQTIHDPNERMRFEMRGGLEGEIDLRFEPTDDGGTRFTYAAEYDLPNSVLVEASKPVIRAFNERQLTATLRNVAAEFE